MHIVVVIFNTLPRTVLGNSLNCLCIAKLYAVVYILTGDNFSFSIQTEYLPDVEMSMVKYQPGKIIVVCRTSVTGKHMEQMIKDFGLKFGNCCVQGDFYFVRVPEGKEKLWANAFKGQDGVISATQIPVFSDSGR